MKMASNILAVVYSDGLAADKFIADWGYALRAAGHTVAGIAQRNSFVRNLNKCDMEVEELYSGAVLQLSQDRGPEARGCRLDRGVLAEVAALLNTALDDKPDILVLNKFGKTEAEGSGLRDVLGKAVGIEVPIVVGVPFRNIEQWRNFAGDMAEECRVDPVCVGRWLAARGLMPEQQRQADAATDNSRTAN